MMIRLEQLASATSRDPEIHSGDLVFSGTRVPVETFLERLEAGEELADVLEGYPTVSALTAWAVADCWEEVRRRTDSGLEARRRVVALADWARVSAHAARQFARGEARLSDPPWLGELLQVVTAALDAVGGRPPPDPGSAAGPGPGSGPGQGEGEDGPTTAAQAQIDQAVDSLTDARTWVSTAADELHGLRPVHSAYLRALHGQLDDVKADLLVGPGDP